MIILLPLLFLLIIWALKPLGNKSLPEPENFDYKVQEIMQKLYDDKLISKKEEDKIPPVNSTVWKPKDFTQFIGQYQAKEQAKTLIKKAQRGMKAHVFVNGIKGHGKTTYIELIAKELKASYIYRIGKQVDEKSLPSIIEEINQSKNEFIVFFIDEIDTMESEDIKMLNPLIENFLWNNQPVNPFIFAGATINKHKLIENNPDTLDRIYTHINFERYTEKELAIILNQYQKNLFPYDLIEDKIIDIISLNCKFNPRTGIGLLEDYIVENNIEKVLYNHNIVKNGLTKRDIQLLMVLNESKKAIGAKALAMRVGMTEREYITEYEPFLVEFGYIARIPSRIITDLGKEVLLCVKRLV